MSCKHKDCTPPARKKGRAAMNKEMAEHMHKHMKEVARDVEHVTLGWLLDNDLQQGVVEFSVVAKKGTKTAKQFAQLGGMRTNFGGFRVYW